MGGAAKVAEHVPTIQPEPAGAEPPRLPPLPPTKGLLYPGDEEPLLNFPGLDAAVKLLHERRVMSADEFYKLSAAAKQEAFTISGDLTAHSIDRIRQILAETLEAGPSYQQFARAVHDAIDKLPIGEAHLEQVYRNAVNESYSQGMESILAHPIVTDGFPYRAFHAIHDARCRPDHRALETQGLDGTNVYNALDPVWAEIRPPFSWGCRCGWTAISVRTAAGLGVKEAQRWLNTGERPAEFQFVRWPTYDGKPIMSPPGWSRTGVAA